jgi:glycosyltransferase involved in cell wall biosynthesis
MIKEQMLAVLPVPFLVRDNTVLVEEQARNGLRRWADHFERVVVAAPAMPEAAAASESSFVWKPLEAFDQDGRLELRCLPWAYERDAFLRSYRKTRALLADLISRSTHLQFAIGGLVGDWAAIAALEADRQKRRYAIHTDRVEHEVLRALAMDAPPLKRLKVSLISGLTKRYHRHLIARCSLGLWHGLDCYSAYAPWCRESHLIHDIHTNVSDCIDDAALETKARNVASAEFINICYAGRLDPMKAPLDWLRAVAAARDLGAPLRAVWFGDGSLRNQAEQEVKRLKLEGTVELPGFTSDRSALLSALRDSHLMAFTHITPESPRCLLEALISGTPIVGYENRFASDLTAQAGGGTFVPTHHWPDLGRRIAALCGNRSQLADLIIQAGRNGKRFNDSAVFAERSALIKAFC